MKKRKFPLYLKIFAGMIAGITAGMIAVNTGGEWFVKNWVAPWGEVFIKLLGLIAVPLVFISLIKGILELKDISKFSTLGGKTAGIYLMTTVFAVVIGLTVGLTVKSGSMVDKSSISNVRENYHEFIESKKAEAALSNDKGPLAFLTEIVPNNITNAMSNNSKMLQIIFFAIFFSVAALAVAPEKIKPVLTFFESLNEILLRMVDYIISFAPVGVMALMANMVVDFKGDAGLFVSLSVYALTVILSMLFIIFVLYPLIVRIFTKIKAKDFIKTMYPVQLFAFTTSSSAATLPVNMKIVKNELKVSEETASFVLPAGVTVNMDGTSCYQAIAVVFIAQILGIELEWHQILVILGMTILSSIGTPGIPGGSYVVLAMVMTSTGIPVEGLAIILGIDRPLDMLRTAVNVTGDAMVACLVDPKKQKKKTAEPNMQEK
ncbi:MAG: dicarboxylate/amino acid:cation symporter [Prevotellaceae bacterium]|jgi:Na+/H+-dicarboxylate symporter|nr:dicarboxylate/amino acid:cation symporter [Prevotellaceae bacterium]